MQVVGYMGVDYRGKDMTSHPQYITVRNERGQRMLDTVGERLQILPTMQVLGLPMTSFERYLLFAQKKLRLGVQRTWILNDLSDFADAVHRLETGGRSCCRQSSQMMSECAHQLLLSNCTCLRPPLSVVPSAS